MLVGLVAAPQAHQTLQRRSDKHTEMASPIDTNVAAIHVPRLPILGRRIFGSSDPVQVPSVVDGRSFVLTTSGRAALVLALQALGIRAGDRVLVPTYHCPTMIAPVIHAGAVPVYYAIGEDGLPKLDGIVVDGRARAMLVAHWFGFPLRLSAVAAWCRSRDIALVEDCAHAFFGASDEQAVGRAGDLCIASLTKFFPVPEGGCIAGHADLLARIELARAPLGVQLRCVLDVVEAAADYRRLGALNGVAQALLSLKARMRGQRHAEVPQVHAVGVERTEQDVAACLNPATCGRSPAWVASAIFRHVDRPATIDARRRNYSRLVEMLSGVRGARPLRPVLSDGTVPYVFPLEVDRPESTYHAIRRAGVPVFRWDRLWAGTPVLPGDAGARWSQHVLQLGCHQDIAEAELVSLAGIVRTHIEREGG